MITFPDEHSKDYGRTGAVLQPKELMPLIFNTLIEAQPEGTIVVSGRPKDNALKLYQPRLVGVTLPRNDIDGFLNILLITSQLSIEPTEMHTLRAPSLVDDSTITLDLQLAQMMPLLDVIAKAKDYKGPLPHYFGIVLPWNPKYN